MYNDKCLHITHKDKCKYYYLSSKYNNIQLIQTMPIDISDYDLYMVDKHEYVLSTREILSIVEDKNNIFVFSNVNYYISMTKRNYNLSILELL